MLLLILFVQYEIELRHFILTLWSKNLYIDLKSLLVLDESFHRQHLVCNESNKCFTVSLQTYVDHVSSDLHAWQLVANLTKHVEQM